MGSSVDRRQCVDITCCNAQNCHTPFLTQLHTTVTPAQDDPQLRVLRFLDNMLSRDNLAKAAFLKDLSSCWDAFDSRVLRYKVLPPLLNELRNEALQTLVLPLVIRVVQQQSKQDFMDFTLPALKPICDHAKGDTLLLLVKHTQLLVDNMPPEAVAAVVVPMLLRAAEGGDTRAQEEMLKTMPLIHEQVDYQSLKTVLLPKVWTAWCLSRGAPKHAPKHAHPPGTPAVSADNLSCGACQQLGGHRQGRRAHGQGRG